MVISLGLLVGVCDLYAPHGKCVIPHSSYRPHSSCGSDTLRTVICLSNRRLQVLVREGMADSDIPDSAISESIYLDPLQTIRGASRCGSTTRSGPDALKSKPGRSAVCFIAPGSRSSLPVVGFIL